MTTPSRTNDVWYRGGLSFECTRCGACCTGAEGFVWLNAEEIERLAQRTGLDVDAFRKTYARRVGGGISLREKPNGDCIFWSQDVGCTVYDDRPRQCRSWPFWNSNIETPEAWDATRRACPGSGQGQLFTVEEIRRQASLIDI
jgi:Fe-S-cluster containining protein